MNTTQKPVMVRAGVYDYRGIRIERVKKKQGFAFKVRYVSACWNYYGYGLSLAQACREVDGWLENSGYEPRNGWMCQVAR